MQIGRKPYCRNCRRHLDINTDYKTYTCPAAYITGNNNGSFLITPEDERFMHLKKNSRCPEKAYFLPRWTKKQVCEHNNHK